jgi:3-oxoacyl-[acyl-carrier protein] reductase
MDAVIIFGGAGGIGSAVAALAKTFGPIVLVGRTESSLLSTAESIPGGDIITKVADVTHADKVWEIVEEVSKTRGRKIAVINCVGSILLKPAHMISPQEFSDTLSLNLISAFNCVRALGKWGDSGSNAVLVSSCAAGIGLANHEAISAAKAGVEGLTRSFAASYASKGIRCNCVAPGLVMTSLTSRITHTPQAVAFSEALHPLGRLGIPTDVAPVITFLADSAQSSWITGQVFRVDGGLATLKTKE